MICRKRGAHFLTTRPTIFRAGRPASFLIVRWPRLRSPFRSRSLVTVGPSYVTERPNGPRHLHPGLQLCRGALPWPVLPGSGRPLAPAGGRGGPPLHPRRGSIHRTRSSPGVMNAAPTFHCAGVRFIEPGIPGFLPIPLNPPLKKGEETSGGRGRPPLRE